MNNIAYIKKEFEEYKEKFQVKKKLLYSNIIELEFFIYNQMIKAKKEYLKDDTLQSAIKINTLIHLDLLLYNYKKGIYYNINRND